MKYLIFVSLTLKKINSHVINYINSNFSITNILMYMITSDRISHVDNSSFLFF